MCARCQGSLKTSSLKHCEQRQSFGASTGLGAKSGSWAEPTCKPPTAEQLVARYKDLSGFTYTIQTSSQTAQRLFDVVRPLLAPFCSSMDLLISSCALFVNNRIHTCNMLFTQQQYLHSLRYNLMPLLGQYVADRKPMSCLLAAGPAASLELQQAGGAQGLQAGFRGGPQCTHALLRHGLRAWTWRQQARNLDTCGKVMRSCS